MFRDSSTRPAETDEGVAAEVHSVGLPASGDAAAGILSSAPAGPTEQRLALGMVLLSLVAFGVLVPFARQPLQPVWAFIPIYETALVVVDLMTALLLLGQFRISGAKSLLVLACGYFFTALIAVVHALSFPG